MITKTGGGDVGGESESERMGEACRQNMSRTTEMKRTRDAALTYAENLGLQRAGTRQRAWCGMGSGRGCGDSRRCG